MMIWPVVEKNMDYKIMLENLYRLNKIKLIKNQMFYHPSVKYVKINIKNQYLKLYQLSN